MSGVLDKVEDSVKGAVFPAKVATFSRGDIEGFGITKRELFAVIALNGLLSNPGFEPYYRSEQIVLNAVDYADRLLKELDK